jgi:hypothetical protein
MKIKVQYVDNTQAIDVDDYTYEDLTNEILKNSCSCYQYELLNTMRTATTQELKELLAEVKDDYYFIHRANDDVERCGEYIADKAEAIADMQRENGILCN